MIEETWVNLAEGAKATGYNREYIQKLVKKISRKPEEEREIRMRWREFYWEVWLPDLVRYINSKSERGPRAKRNLNGTTSS
jgi:hypothetical protein